MESVRSMTFEQLQASLNQFSVKELTQVYFLLTRDFANIGYKSTNKQVKIQSLQECILDIRRAAKLRNRSWVTVQDYLTDRFGD